MPSADAFTKRSVCEPSYSISTQSSIDRFLKSGDYNPLDADFPGSNVIEKLKSVQYILRHELAKTVTAARAQSRFAETKRVPKDLKRYTRRRVEPMVSGLFHPEERKVVLRFLQSTTIFVTDAAIPGIIENDDLYNAWRVANMYLTSHDAQPIGADLERILGFASEGRSYISIEYFAETNPYCDFLVHECAHAFHNNKRRVVGLLESRTKEWLLPIKFKHRETFAYSCEFFSKIVALSRSKADRIQHLSKYRDLSPCPPDSADVNEVDQVLEQAVHARSGWKKILYHCARE